MVSNPTERSTLFSGASAYAESESGRMLQRRPSDGAIVAIVAESASVSQIMISTDDGATWTQGDTTLPVYSTRAWDLEYNPTAGAFHAAYHDYNTDFVTFAEFTIDSAGTVSLTTEQVTDFGKATAHGGLVAVDSAGTTFVVAQKEYSSKGSIYIHPYLYRRDGAGSYTQLAQLTTGQTGIRHGEMVIDSQDRIHVAGYDNVNSDVRYNRYDPSSGTVAVNDMVVSLSDESIGSLVVDDADNPVLAQCDSAVTLHRRASGSWTRRVVSSNYAPDSHTLTTTPDGTTFLGGVESGSEEIDYYSGEWADFTSEQTLETLTSSGTSKEVVTSAYQSQQDYAPSAYPTDISWVNGTDGTYEYVQAEIEGTTIATDAGSVTAATAAPTTATSSTRSTDAGALTAAASSSTAAPTTATVFDVGALTAAQATPLAAGSTATATDAGGLTAATTTVLVADETVIVADTQTGTYKVGGGIEFGGPPSL